MAPFFAEHLELLEKGELKSLYDNEHVVEDDEEDLDTNEDDDTEGEEPTVYDDSAVDDGLSDNGDEDLPKGSATEEHRYTALNVAETNNLPEINIEVNFFNFKEILKSMP